MLRLQSLAILGLLACAWSRPATAADPPARELLSRLREWSGAVHSLRADVLVASTPVDAAARRRLAEAKRVEDAWLVKNANLSQEAAAERAKNTEAAAQGLPVKRSQYRFWLNDPLQLRLEMLGDPDKPAAADPITKVFTGDRWQRYTPRGRVANDPSRPGQLSVTADDADAPVFSAALGRNAKTHQLFLEFLAKSAPSYVAQLGAIEWDDLFELASTKGAVTSRVEPLPTGAKSVPMIEFVCRANEMADGRIIYRLWLDPAQSYAPACLEMKMQWRETDGRRQDILDERVEWNSYSRVAGAAAVPTECVTRQYAQVSAPTDAKSMGLQQSFEGRVVTTRFTNLRVNEAPDEGLFRIAPPPGTQVIDEVRRQGYIVGSAGNELDRFALRERSESPPPPVPTGTAWRAFIWWLCAGAVIGTCLVLLYFRRRRGSA